MCLKRCALAWTLKAWFALKGAGRATQVGWSARRGLAQNRHGARSASLTRNPPSGDVVRPNGLRNSFASPSWALSAKLDLISVMSIASSRAGPFALRLTTPTRCRGRKPGAAPPTCRAEEIRQATTAQATRSKLLVTTLQDLARLAFGTRRRQARDGPPMAPPRLPTLLALEVSSEGRTSRDQCGDPRTRAA